MLDLTRSVILFASVIVLTCGGTSCTPPTESAAAARSSALPFLIADAECQYDFGAVLGRPDRRLVHQYQLVNRSAAIVQILDIANRKPCCGAIVVGKRSLASGEATTVELTFTVGDRIGLASHEMELATDLPSQSRIVLRTTAEVHPSLRVEEVEVASAKPLIRSVKPTRVEYRVFAAGTVAEPAVDLDLAKLRSDLAVAWSDRKEADSIVVGGGLKVESRCFVALLETTEKGDHRAEIALIVEDQVKYTHVLSWRVVTPLVATPPAVVIQLGQQGGRVLLRAHDQLPFRVLRIESEAPGVRARCANDTAARQQHLEVAVDPALAPERAVLSIYTDHPTQVRFDLPVVVLK